MSVPMARKKSRAERTAAEMDVSAFYNSIGWDASAGATTDALLWEDLRPHAAQYVHRCRMRVLDHIPPSGVNMLDLGSGPIQYPEYLEYSRNFQKRYCVDLSTAALEEAEKKIGDHGEFFGGSFFDIDFEENFFDCSISLHTIYHMDRDEQEAAIRKLLYVTKPGQPVVVVYTNNRNLIRILSFPVRMPARAIRTLLTPAERRRHGNIYRYSHPPAWWSRFEDAAQVRFFPFRSLASEHQKLLFPNNRLGEAMFSYLFRMETRWPRFFARWFQYPIIVLTKRA